MSNETLFAITVSILSLIGVLASAWLQLRGKRAEVLQKQLDSADQQETILRGDLFRAWEREKALREKVEEDKQAMAATITQLTNQVAEINKKAETAAKEVSVLTTRVVSLEKELQHERESGALKQTEIDDLTKQVARLERKVASLEGGQ